MHPSFIKLREAYINPSAIQSIALVAEKTTAAEKPANPNDFNPYEHSEETRVPEKYILTYISGDRIEVSKEEGIKLIAQLEISKY